MYADTRTRDELASVELTLSGCLVELTKSQRNLPVTVELRFVLCFGSVCTSLFSTGCLMRLNPGCVFVYRKCFFVLTTRCSLSPPSVHPCLLAWCYHTWLIWCLRVINITTSVCVCHLCLCVCRTVTCLSLPVKLHLLCSCVSVSSCCS